MCKETVENNPKIIRHVLTHFIIKQMCDNTIWEPGLLSLIP